MSAAKTRFPKVSLEELVKILPKEVMDGNENHRGRPAPCPGSLEAGLHNNAANTDSVIGMRRTEWPA